MADRVLTELFSLLHQICEPVPPLEFLRQGQIEEKEVQVNEQEIFPVHVKLLALYGPAKLNQ